MTDVEIATKYLEGMIDRMRVNLSISIDDLNTVKNIINQSNTLKTTSLQTELRPVKMGLFPQLNTLNSVVELGYSQLPITNKNELFGLLMTYHNTLINEVNNASNKTNP